jgi:ferric-dicitrate binding protein FerR (iron transport regulator)
VVTVYEGKVRVVPSHAAPVEVGPGQAVTVGADGASVARAAAPAPVARGAGRAGGDRR